jgi:hypothetical protein
MIISHGALLSLGEVCLSIWECTKLDKTLETTWKKHEGLHKVRWQRLKEGKRENRLFMTACYDSP